VSELALEKYCRFLEVRVMEEREGDYIGKVLIIIYM
jgi:hypothetical protein